MASEPCPNCADRECVQARRDASRSTWAAERMWGICGRRAKERALAEVARLTAELAEARKPRWVEQFAGKHSLLQAGAVLCCVHQAVWRAQVVWEREDESGLWRYYSLAEAQAAAEAAQQECK